MTYAHLLGLKRAERLATESPDVQRLVLGLISGDATNRMRGLDGVFETLLAHGRVTGTAAEAIPHLLALATGKGYPESSALLIRLGTVLGVFDDPPRSTTDGLAWEAYHSALPALLRLAHTSRDPEAARAAALIASRFAQVDGDVEPLLLAMLTGAGERSPCFIYALARVQLARDHALHSRVRKALQARPPTPDSLAAALALVDADAPNDDALAVLGHLARARPRGWLDPRRPGTLLDLDAIDQALEGDERARSRSQERRGGDDRGSRSVR